MNNPLRIFSSTQIDSLDQQKLKQLKKEILLEFQLTSQSAININGEEIDKNGIIQIFDELDQRLPLYLFIHQNKTLNSFLNGEDTELLVDDIAISKIKNLPEYECKHEIEQKILYRLKHLISNIVKTPNHQKINELANIKNFILQLIPDLVDDAYSKAYGEIKIYLEYLDDEFKSPFDSPSSMDFHTEIGKHVNFDFYNLFKHLPDSFNALSLQYCYWCNDNIVYASFQNEKHFKKYSKKSLSIIRRAALIASENVNEKNNKKIAKDILAFINHDSSNAGGSAWAIFVVIFFILKLIVVFNKCSRSNNNYTTNSNIYTQNKNYHRSTAKDYTPEYLEELAKKRQQKKNGNYYRKNKNSMLDFIGEKKLALNSKLVNINELETLTELTFDVDIIPSRNDYFYKLIPKSVAEKHKGKLWTIVMIFRHPNLKKSTLEHRLKVDFRSKNGIYQQQYNYKKSATVGDLKLSLKRISNKNYPLKGVITRFDATKKIKLYSSTFKIDYSKEKKTYTVSGFSKNKKITFSNDYISNLSPSYTMDEKDKFAIAIKNINAVNQKYLNEGNYYSLNNILGYTLDNSTNKDFPSSTITSDDVAHLKYYITSEEDNTSYVELKGKKVNLKYYADFTSGRIKGLTMVTADNEITEVEHITLFENN